MTDIVKVKQGGTQVFPQTHWNAVEGKPEVLKGEKGDPGPQGPKEIKETLVRKVQQGKMQQRQTLQPQ